MMDADCWDEKCKSNAQSDSGKGLSSYLRRATRDCQQRARLQLHVDLCLWQSSLLLREIYCQDVPLFALAASADKAPIFSMAYDDTPRKTRRLVLIYDFHYTPKFLQTSPA